MADETKKDHRLKWLGASMWVWPWFIWKIVPEDAGSEITIIAFITAGISLIVGAVLWQTHR
jgi:hypothetical protein